MKKYALVLALVFVVGGLSSCSSKETRTGEPMISGSTGTGDMSTASSETLSGDTKTANLGSSSSGQGR